MPRAVRRPQIYAFLRIHSAGESSVALGMTTIHMPREMSLDAPWVLPALYICGAVLSVIALVITLLLF